MEGLAGRALYEGLLRLLRDDVESDLDLYRDSRARRHGYIEYHDSNC